MVDIMDMEDIFKEILDTGFGELAITGYSKALETMAKWLIKEVSDYVEGQQTIKCANCKGYKFKDLKSWNR